MIIIDHRVEMGRFPRSSELTIAEGTCISRSSGHDGGSYGSNR